MTYFHIFNFPIFYLFLGQGRIWQNRTTQIELHMIIIIVLFRGCFIHFGKCCDVNRGSDVASIGFNKLWRDGFSKRRTTCSERSFPEISSWYRFQSKRIICWFTDHEYAQVSFHVMLCYQKYFHNLLMRITFNILSLWIMSLRFRSKISLYYII